MMDTNQSSEDGKSVRADEVRQKKNLTDSQSGSLTSKSSFSIGQRVLVHGLMGDTEFNGMKAIVRRIREKKAYLMLEADGRLIYCSVGNIIQASGGQKPAEGETAKVSAQEAPSRSSSAVPSYLLSDASQKVGASAAEKLFQGAKWFGASLYKKISNETRVFQEWQLGLYRVSNRILCIRFPSSTGYALKPIDSLARWLDGNFKGRYMVWNLSQKPYDYKKFGNQVVEIRPSSSGALSVQMLFGFVKSIHSWLLMDDTNVSVIHCQDGGGTSMCALACYLLWSKDFSSLNQAFHYVEQCKGVKCKEVVSATQLRNARYFEKVLQSGPSCVSRGGLVLRRVLMHTVPKFSPNQSCKPYIQVLTNGKAIYTGAEMGSRKVRECLQEQGDLCFPIEKEVRGEFVIQVCHCINKTQAVCMFRICLDTAFIQEGVKRIDVGDAEISKKHDHRFHEDWYVDLIFKSTADNDDSNGGRGQKTAVLSENGEETRGNTSDEKGKNPQQHQHHHQLEKDAKDGLQDSSSTNAATSLPTRHWSDNILLEPTKRLHEEYRLLRAEIPPDEDCVKGATLGSDAATASSASGLENKNAFSTEKKGRNRILTSPDSRASERLLTDIDKDLEDLRALHSGSISPTTKDTSQILDSSSLDAELLGIRTGADPKDIFLEDDMDDDELLKQLQAELEESSI